MILKLILKGLKMSRLRDERGFDERGPKDERIRPSRGCFGGTFSQKTMLVLAGGPNLNIEEEVEFSNAKKKKRHKRR